MIEPESDDNDAKASDADWGKAAALVNRINGSPPKQKQPSQSTRLPGEDLTEDELRAEELEGEKMRGIFQAAINASAESKSRGENPITLLTAAYPELSSYGGTGMSRTFSRNIETCLGDNRLKAIYSKKQLIALAAARTIAPILDEPPGELHNLHAACCYIAKTHQPKQNVV